MKNYQKEALKVAKKSILEQFWERSIFEHFWEKLLKKYHIENKELLEKKACFVTLKSFWEDLRWCIWNIFPVWSLYDSIASNAKNSAFNDPRFSLLTKDELQNNDLFIEITILSKIQEKKFLSLKELLQFLKENKPWLMIELDNKQATFLPSVWHEIKSEEAFLTYLIYKAWIDIDKFIRNFSKVKTSFYTWEEFWEYFNEI